MGRNGNAADCQMQPYMIAMTRPLIEPVFLGTGSAILYKNILKAVICWTCKRHQHDDCLLALSSNVAAGIVGKNGAEYPQYGALALEAQVSYFRDSCISGYEKVLDIVLLKNGF